MGDVDKNGDPPEVVAHENPFESPEHDAGNHDVEDHGELEVDGFASLFVDVEVLVSFGAPDEEGDQRRPKGDEEESDENG